MQIDQTVDQVETIDEREFNECYLEQKPLHMTGMTADWKARSWTPEYFAKTFRDAEVFVEHKTRLTEDAQVMVQLDHERLRLGDFVARLLAMKPNPGYLNVYPIFTQFPGLKEHVQFPEFGWKESPTWNDLYLGPRGSRAPLHYDTQNNLFCQLHGRKSFIVVSPKYHEACYPVNECWLDGYSKVDVTHPDFEKFPHFKEVHATEVILNPGDILYVPPKWWHTVQSLDISISITKWFVTESFYEKYKDKMDDPEELGGYNYPITEDMIMTHS